MYTYSVNAENVPLQHKHMHTDVCTNYQWHWHCFSSSTSFAFHYYISPQILVNRSRLLGVISLTKSIHHASHCRRLIASALSCWVTDIRQPVASQSQARYSWFSLKDQPLLVKISSVINSNQHNMNMWHVMLTHRQYKWFALEGNGNSNSRNWH